MPATEWWGAFILGCAIGAFAALVAWIGLALVTSQRRAQQREGES